VNQRPVLGRIRIKNNRLIEMGVSSSTGAATAVGITTTPAATGVATTNTTNTSATVATAAAITTATTVLVVTGVAAVTTATVAAHHVEKHDAKQASSSAATTGAWWYSRYDKGIGKWLCNSTAGHEYLLAILANTAVPEIVGDTAGVIAILRIGELNSLNYLRARRAGWQDEGPNE
jgi:hypothetical protein